MASTDQRTGGITRVLIPLAAALAVVLAFALPASIQAHEDNSGPGPNSGPGSHEGDDDDDDGGHGRGRGRGRGRGGDDDDDDDEHAVAPPAAAVPQSSPPRGVPPAGVPAATPAPPARRRRGRRPQRPAEDNGRAHQPPARTPVSAPPPVVPGDGVPVDLPDRAADPSAGAPRRAAASVHPRTRRALGARAGSARDATGSGPGPAEPVGRRRGPGAAVGLALQEPTSNRPVAGVEPLVLALAGLAFLLAAAMLRPGWRRRIR